MARGWEGSAPSEQEKRKHLEHCSGTTQSLSSGLESDLMRRSKGPLGQVPPNLCGSSPGRQSTTFLPSEGSKPLPDGISAAGLSVHLAAESKAEQG
jgi:hypothetical protein